MNLALIDVAKAKGESDRTQPYWNAYHCQSKITGTSDKIYGNYCKNRFCTICTAIRKADIINRYYPVLKEWKDPHFITLTIRTVKLNKLQNRVLAMQRAFRLIKGRCNKRHQRGKGIKLVGVKSLECNFNPIKKTYNPHFHIITPDKETAELLKKEWMIQWTPKHTSPKAQKIRRVKSLERDLIETIKYGSKIFTEPDVMKKKGANKLDKKIYVNALDEILIAMKGKRLFDRFGFNLPKQKRSEASLKFIDKFIEWEFQSDSADWVDIETGEKLTGFIEPLELSYLLDSCVDLVEQ